MITDDFKKDFADELLYAQSEGFPSWIGCYRNKSIENIDKYFVDLCYELKNGGVSFKIKEPIKVKGRWKFTDVFIKDRDIVILLIQDHQTIGLPCHSKTDRELSFGDDYKILPIHTYEINKVVELLEKIWL